MNLLRAPFLGRFAVIFPALLFAAGLGFGQTNSALIHVQVKPFSYYGAVSPNYDGHHLTIRSNPYSMTATAKSGFYFTNWTVLGVPITVTNKTKLTFSVTSTNELTFIANFADKQKPSLAITVPANNSVLTNSEIIVAGTASDNDTVTNVYYNLNGLGWVSASPGNGWKTWWVNLALAPNTNSVQVYAVDRSGLCSATNKLKLTYATAPTSLSGAVLTVPDQDYVANFCYGTNRTFSDGTSVGIYNYKKTGPVTAKLILNYIAPPSASNSDTVYLQFTNATTDDTSGIFSDADDYTNIFTLTRATNSPPQNITASNSKIRLTSTNGTNQSLLVFLKPPQVVSDGSAFVTNNPLRIRLDSAYPGQVGDRVKTTFNHQKSVNGSWVSNAPVALAGTVAAIRTTNTVTVFFDVGAYTSHTDLYSLMTNVPLNILTFYYYTNDADGSLVAYNPPGTFVYTNYSPVGSMLELYLTDTNEYYILTFTNLSSANPDYSGTYYTEAYGGLNRHLRQSLDFGSFSSVFPPAINGNGDPKSISTTNGGTATFTVDAAGSPPLTYQWQFSLTGTNGWADLAEVTTNLTISPATTNDIGSYRVIVANAFGSVTSSVAALTITLKPAIISSPSDKTLSANDTSASFNVTAIGFQPLSYQWYSGTNQLGNGSYFTNGSGSAESVINSTNLTIQQISSTNFAAGFQVIIANDYGSVTSRIATLSFTASGPPTP